MPIMDVGRGTPHQLGADLHLVDRLEHHGYEFDVITDLELHTDGFGHGHLGSVMVALLIEDSRRRRDATLRIPFTPALFNSVWG